MKSLKGVFLIACALGTLSVNGFSQTADEALAQKVRDRINGSVWYGLNDYVSATAVGSSIQLTGWTHNEWTAQQLERIVSKVPGVTHVDNRIEPTFGSDELADRALRAIYSDPIFYDRLLDTDPPIHVIAMNNSICLAGKVLSPSERSRAEMLADMNSRALSVYNTLMVVEK